ncbi:N(G),N(G)-dimethylarginine dimethylaminohydrolase [Gimesia aquarii]|uniref:N(G),N(G)-dimethylarginine dimethylaminohydrolase n=2 Tax=Gimesia aquarii TaxID=2527964 RepID=A0A517WQI7_9PLAN|nr:N(G),N(G)-dimethylarginine dimethylaminohydrolase [Gimesia aquarii]
MCPPDYYGIEYEINPWMSRSQQSDPEVARQQWESLYQVLNSLNARIELLTPVKGLPDLVFTANAGLIWKERVFLALFRHEARQGETPVDQEWFQDAGFETIEMPDDYFFEGAGDALFCGETLFAGYLIRSDVRAMQWVAEKMNCRVIPLQLVDDFYYHLDTCFCPLSETEAIYYPPAFDEYGQQALKEHVPHLIPVVEKEAQRFACNAVVIGKSVALNTGCPQLEKDLNQLGYETYSTPLDEFIKAGGSAKCLTLRLDGECAAVWP